MPVFKRKIYNKLSDWKNDSQGKTALLIQGARRIGKSTIVEEFGKHEYESYILIDFSNVSKDIKTLFEDISDLDYFFRMLQFYCKVSLVNRKSLIIFDEVQLFPLARQAIKHLVKDGRYDYIETGSLISIKRNVENILIPSEERKINMYPLDYEEFLWAMGDNVSYNFLKSIFESKHQIGEGGLRQVMRDFRLYMIVGGMPQAISTLLETNDFRKVDDVKRDILQLYEDDFAKIDKTGRLSAFYNNIPAQLNSNASRYQVSSIDKNLRLDDTQEIISELVQSMTVNIAYHVNDPNRGMGFNKDINRFKLFFSDTGLFITQIYKDKDFTENIIYNKLLSDKMEANLGYVYENIVAQMLKSNGHELFYYTFPQETSNHNYEIDFLISKENKICPIEVKSSGYKRHASIDAFSEKFSSRILEKYLIYTKDLKKDGDLLYLPVPMGMFL